MHFTAVGGLEGNWTDGALVKDLAVFLLNVSLLSLKGLENHITVKTSGRKENIVPLFRNTALYVFNKACVSCLLSYLYQALRA